MTVYLLLVVKDYDNLDLVGVFSSEAKAVQAADELHARWSYRIEPIEVDKLREGYDA